MTPVLGTPPTAGATAMVGLAADAGNPGGLDARGRAGVALEQGDGWSVEHWPAGAAVAVVSGPTAADRLAPGTGTAPADAMGRAAKVRSGSRGEA